MPRPHLTITPTQPPPARADSRGPPSSLSSARPPSSASFRPPSSASFRPPSSASLRPPSSASTRPSSSLSTYRPPSSASVRPASRISQRPGSRASLRPPTRQSARHQPAIQTLVEKLTGLDAEEHEDAFRVAIDSVARSIDSITKTAPSSNMGDMDKQVQGRVRKARIVSQDPWANALGTAYANLKEHMQQSNDLDMEINPSRLADHLQLLMLLSRPPDEGTLQHAEDYLENIRNPPPKPPGLTWKDILDEEPFEGDHWEGVYGLPPGSTVEGWETKSLDSTPPLSPLDSGTHSDVELASLDSTEPIEPISLPVSQKTATPIYRDDPYAHRREVEELQARQYWRVDWHPDVPPPEEFDIGDASSFGPSITRVSEGNNFLGIHSNPPQRKYIHEHDMVREVLIALQGRHNIILRWTHRDSTAFFFEPYKDAPQLAHLSPASQTSILQSFARTATVVEHLRKFTASILANAARVVDPSIRLPRLSGHGSTPTLSLQAFSDAVASHLRVFDKWCAAQEEAIGLARAGVGPPTVVSLLSLEKHLRNTFSRSFEVLLDVTRQAMRRASRSHDADAEIWVLAELPVRMAPSAASTLLLDALLAAVQDHLAMGDATTSDALMHAFVEAAEPTWRLIRSWLQDGMPILNQVERQRRAPLGVFDDEFFVEDNELTILDPDFWTDGYALRDGSDEIDGPKCVPMFLGHIAPFILGAGKSIGLLRALGITVAVEDEVDAQAHCLSFSSLVTELSSDGRIRTFSVDDLSRLAYDSLLPRCQIVQSQLAQVVIEDCQLWTHLTAIEDIYLMRRGDVMSRVCDAIFAKADSGQSWGDFHFLNSVFRNITTSGPDACVDPALVRLSYRGGRDGLANQSVRAFEGLSVEYAAPFPLTYVFGPRATQVYSSIFVFLLQIRRAKSVLERILVRGSAKGARAGNDLKMLYALRSRLSWFLTALFDFITTHVIHTQLLKFHKALKDAKSLDEIIELHQDHNPSLNTLEDRCLLQSNTSSLRRAVVSILDMALYFNNCFVAFAGDTTLDISRQSLTGLKKHRSRRLQRLRRNAIGFAQSLRERDSDSSDSDSDTDLEGDAPTVVDVLAPSQASFEEEGFGRIDKMSGELDGLVRFVRRGVESLAGGASEAASAFGIFAFTLEDWDK